MMQQLVVMGCALWLATALVPVRAADPEEARAREIVAQRCYSCHGLTGLPTTTLFPKLAGQNVEYLIKQMFNFQAGARRSVVMEDQMVGLSGNEIEALARYFSRQKSMPDPAPDRTLLERGRQLFFAGKPEQGVSACVSCHGPQARGAQMLPRLAGQHATYIERQLQAFTERARTNDRNKMHQVARGLSQDDMRAVAYFISSMD